MEWGVDPGASVRDMHQRMLTDDPALELRPGAAEAGDPPATGEMAQRRLRWCRQSRSLHPQRQAAEAHSSWSRRRHRH